MWRPQPLLLLILLSACSAPPTKSPSVSSPSSTFLTAPVLEPGCLLPEPHLLKKAPLRSATIQLRVDELGKVSQADWVLPTGVSEVDAALRAAAQRCRFSPAYTVDLTTRSKSYVSSTHTLEMKWPAEHLMTGPMQCLMPEYPHAARRAEEEGLVSIQYRLESSSQMVDARVVESPRPLRLLHPLSLRAVMQCLEHPSVRQSLPPDKWFKVAIHWRLES